MNKNSNEKAITLIALVITIVVLIILASVAISLSLGENGLFNKAKTATEEYTNAQKTEETEIAEITNKIDSFINGNRNELASMNYSYDEKLVGTWLNGKDLYQKTITLPLPTVTTMGVAVTSETFLTDLGLPDSEGYDIDNIVFVKEGIVIGKSGVRSWVSPVTLCIPDHASNGNNKLTMCWLSSDSNGKPLLYLRSNRTDENGDIAVITLCYTK